VAPLLPLLAETGRLQTRLEELRAAVTARHAALRTALPATGTDGPVRASLPPARAVLATARTALARAAELTALAHQEREADRLAQDNDTLARRAVEIGGLVAEAAEWLEAAPSRRAELVTARDAAHDARARLGDAAAARDRAVARVAAAARRDDLAQRLVALADALRARTDDHQAALARLQDVRERRLAGMAAELAGRLSAGSDCPVCGSPEHPRPAQPGADPVTRELEDALRADAAAADVTRQQAAAALAAAEAELAAAREAAGGDGAAAELGAAAQDLEEVAARLARLAAEAPAADAALASFDRDREQWLRQRVALDEEARVLATRVREQRQRVDQLTALLGRARGDDASVSAGARRLEALSRDLDGLAEQLAEMEQLDGAVAEALARAEAEVHRRRLASIDEVAAAARDDDQMAALERFCLDHDTELGSVTEQLAEPALATAPDAAPDLEPLRAAVAGATARRDAALTTGAAADRRVTELERLRRELADVLAERGPVADAQRTVDRLSRLAEGKSADNRLRMSLSAYVLAARLEQVAASASSRLLRMTSGRYSLLHAATSGTGRGRGGLALRVLDAWTGQERDPATLSGGESFSASLALALGLADVVTAEAGGALLETLFVDEGFGSLDEDTLDEVMNVLDDLRDGGRTVGLVSHVADLRQRIPVQLAVAKGRRGSVIRQ
jgi:exonuclease SbcC